MYVREGGGGNTKQRKVNLQKKTGKLSSTLGDTVSWWMYTSIEKLMVILCPGGIYTSIEKLMVILCPGGIYIEKLNVVKRSDGMRTGL